MAVTTGKVYATEFAMISSSAKNTNYSKESAVDIGYSLNDPTRSSRFALIGFGNAPSELSFRSIISASVFVYASKISNVGCMIECLALTEAFDESTVTYSSCPGVLFDGADRFTSIDATPGYKVTEIGGSISRDKYKFAVEHGVRIGFAEMTVHTSRGQNKPYLEISYDTDETVGLMLSDLSPSSGFVNEKEPNIFSWKVEANGLCFADVQQASCVFRWKEVGQSQVHEIVGGAENSIVVPAGTFTGASVQWQISVTANSGVVTTSEWMTLSTEDAMSESAGLSPASIVLDGASEQIFQWRHIISTGAEPTGFDLQTSSDGNTFSTIKSGQGNAQSVVIPANTLPGGNLWWRVRTYNTDNVPGAWSEALKVIVLAAPPVPVVSIVEASPRPRIRWETDGQQAYEVRIGGSIASGIQFGSAQSYRSPAYLKDGVYTVNVRVQNQFGIWSAWGSAALTVKNANADEIVLNCEASHIAELSWTTPGSYDFYLLYRDSVPIAKTTAQRYEDHASIGTVTYQVRGCYAEDGSYGLSPEVACEVLPQVISVLNLDTMEWLPLPLSDAQHREIGKTLSRDVARLQLAGRRYPIVERSEHHAKVLQVTAAVNDRDESRKLEALVGCPVCVKTPKGDMVVGVLQSLQGRENEFFTSYVFSVEQMDWEEAVDLDS